MKGSYIRSGDSDEPMTEFEIYSNEAFRKKYQDDIRPVPRATFDMLDKMLLNHYLDCLKEKKPNLSSLPDKTIYDLMSITRNGQLTLSSVMLFCKYPQAYFPQLCITAIVLPHEKIGELGSSGERFMDNQRIEGNIPEMLDQAISFVRKNMRTKTIINHVTGKREDRTDYPVNAIREALLNSLVHRDYSVHTEGMPIQLLLFPDRIEIKNLGGIYGRLSIDQLGKIQPDTRNPVLVTALEVLGITENRYSGIPTIRLAMEEYGLNKPVFTDDRGTFTVILYKEPVIQTENQSEKFGRNEAELLHFLEVPRSRQEIAEHLGIGTIAYAMQAYINPLIKKNLIKMTIPAKPRSQKQRYVRSENK